MKREYILEGLGCATCAEHIEKEIDALPDVTHAAVNFATSRLTLEVSDNAAMPALINKAAHIAKSIESGVTLRENTPVEHKNHEHHEGLNRLTMIRLSIGALLFIVGLIFKWPLWIEFAVFFTSYLLCGGDVLLRAGKNILKGRVFDENFLMSIATIGAFAIGQFPEGAAVMLFFQIGERLQFLAVNRSRRSITALMDFRPDYANLISGDTIKQVSPESVRIGERILIRPGEKVPLDGLVADGASSLDTSALTGESAPRDTMAGCEILSGSINLSGVLTVEVTKTFGESTISKILDLVQNAAAKKAPTENFIHKFARYYTPVVVFAAVAIAVIPPLILPGASFTDWINRALVFLVVSCPCALVISIPLSFFGGIGAASKHGILIKGGNFLEALNRVDTVVFDKTGTLTQGIFKVTKVHAIKPYSENDVMEYAANGESYSSHPIATSIIEAFGATPNQNNISDFTEIPGRGISLKVKGKAVLVGNASLMTDANISITQPETIGTTVHVCVDGIHIGYIIISDEIKSDSKATVQELRKLGVRKLVMLTGDSRHVGETIGRELDMDEIHAELLPHQKVEELEKLEKEISQRGTFVFVGDGINDAPVLARAHIGVAMGALGSDAAIEAADVVLMTDEPRKLVTAINIAKRTHRIVWQNIIFALSIKLLVLGLGALGLATIWEAVFADVGVTVLAVLNSVRVLKTKS